MYDFKKLVQVDTIADTLAALNAEPSALLIAGGTDLLIKIREGKLNEPSLISIHTVQELKGVTLDAEGTIRIGAATTFTEISQNPLVNLHIPMLALAVAQVGGPQIRNVATIGGNICNGATSADSASTLLTYNSVLELAAFAGKREVPLEEFYLGPGKVALRPGELLTAIKIKAKDYQGFFGQYSKYSQRKAMDIATLGCAVNLKLNPEKTKIADIRLAFGVAAPTPIRCRKTEAALRGRPLEHILFAEIGQGALAEVNPRTSWRASKEFRLQLIQELSQRGLMQAINLAGGSPHA